MFVCVCLNCFTFIIRGMKKLCVLLIVVVSVCSCMKSRERTAQSLIKDHLKKTMKDWKSYESVECGALDSTFVIYPETWQGKKDKERVSELKKRGEEFQAEATDAYSVSKQVRLLDSAIYYLEAARTVQGYLIEKTKTYKGDFNGWRMVHTYRGNNSYGAKIIVTTVFYFDKDLTKITSLSDLED